MRIETRHERRRGCGFRKPGGLYLMAGGLAAECGKLPLALCVCPTCGSGIKPSRGYTWVNARLLAADVPCRVAGERAARLLAGDEGWVDVTRNSTERKVEAMRASCPGCPLGGSVGRAGLLWIGERYYRTPAEFTREAAEQGISRRIAAIPRGFTLGETWILFAHRKAIGCPDGSWLPGIFHAFRPTSIEYVVGEDDSEDKLRRLEERGITLIRVVPVEGEGEPIGAAPLLEPAGEARR